MAQEQTWKTVESSEEFITDIAVGALRELENDNEISDAFQDTKYAGGLSTTYDRENRYGNPLHGIEHNSVEDVTVPADTVDHLKKADTLYAGVAMAAKSGIKMFSEDHGRNLDDYDAEMLLWHIIGIVEEIAHRIQIRPWANETDEIFFEDPVYISSVRS